MASEFVNQLLGKMTLKEKNWADDSNTSLHLRSYKGQ